MNFNLIGAGNIGGTLALLLTRAGLTLNAVHSRTEASAKNICSLIGAGDIAKTLSDLPAADMTIIATPDSAIETIALDLSLNAHMKKGSVAFHCSGALPSAILSSLRPQDIFIASIHPAKSFTNPAQDSQNFSGTWCGIEGDQDALKILTPLFESLGAHLFSIRPDQKTLYHAGTVMACNYLAPLMEAAMQCHKDAGIPPEISWKILEPLIRETITNIGTLGPAKALTGPIARGDHNVVQSHLNAIQSQDPARAALYAALGTAAIPLARDKGATSDEKLNAPQDILTGHLE